ncbi:MAG: ABC transporter [Candidatus Cloacimonadota bacterium]|nr:MAG: ABC transporter [Candidatus Cloacimonadota bacterium]PIE79443.1 MAG: ABC transporter [Candidatus Delongbacteria bacterium]
MKYNSENIRKERLRDIIENYPFIETYFSDNNFDINDKTDLTLEQFLGEFDTAKIEDDAIDIESFYLNIVEFIDQMSQFLGQEDEGISSITILPGQDKSKTPEKFEKFEIKKGEVICIVGPTGSGKSRLLADIEWVAQNDTPTNRKILIDNDIPDTKWRFSISDKLVAQISQNMNFVMDLTVSEFIELHAESRLVENKEEVVQKIISRANDLAGEKFTLDTPITSLSGGQSRALMIADTAILSKSPIILIDEIENAGIDRKEALKLLLSEDKIVLMATHDPILALLGDKRVVIKNGGIDKIIHTTQKEREILGTLEHMDKTLLSYRTKLRNGERLNQL